MFGLMQNIDIKSISRDIKAIYNRLSDTYIVEQILPTHGTVLDNTVLLKTIEPVLMLMQVRKISYMRAMCSLVT